MRKAFPAEDLSAKKALARTVIDRLKQEYPDAGCTLDYDHAWQLLVSVRLAAQCTDARVNMVTPELFGEYPGPAELAAANPEHVEDIIRTIGFFRIGRLQFGEGQRRNIPAGVHHIPRYVGQNTVHRLGIIVLSCHTPLIP